MSDMTKMYKALLREQEGGFFIILHAAPERKAEDFQWYVSNSPDGVGKSPWPGQEYESLTLSNQAITEEDLKGKRLSCHYKSEEAEYESDQLLLLPGFEDIIVNNQFDEISFFGPGGEIRKDIWYKAGGEV